MEKKYGFKGDMTKDEYIISQLRIHNSTHCSVGLTKAEMYELLDKEKVTYKKSEEWNSLFTKVLDLECITLDGLAKMKGIGVRSADYRNTFKITHADVKRLEKFGALTVIGTYTVREYGKYMYCPIYDLKQFETMTEEDMQKLLEEYPKGKRYVAK